MKGKKTVAKKVFILFFIGSLGANFFSLYVLDKAFFYRKHLSYQEESFPNKGLHIRTAQELKKLGVPDTAAFIGGSFVKFWHFPDDMSLRISNQGGLEDKVSQDLEKMQHDIAGSGVDYVIINSGFCEIHNAVMKKGNVEMVIDNNFSILQQIVQLAEENDIIPVLSTLTPVRPVFLFPFTRMISIPSDKKDLENQAFEKYNSLIQSFANKNKLPLIDFHSVMKDEHGQLKKEFSITDGEHIDLEGYHFLNQFLRKELTRLREETH
jgi:lysophospholipase L1-like esterase